MGRERFSAILGKLVYKPQGKLTLVPDSDRREAVSFDTAKDDFGGRSFSSDERERIVNSPSVGADCPKDNLHPKIKEVQL